MPSIDLTPHPSTPCETIRRFQVNVRNKGGWLSLEYSVEGVVANIRLPEPAWPRHADGLWRATCFEAFLKPDPGSQVYYEFNFSPSTAWAAYRFARYRKGMAAVDGLNPPSITLRQDADRLELGVSLDLAGLSLPVDGGAWRLGLSAVIEGRQGGHSYWAGSHPPGKPDFHHGDSFAFKLDSSFL